MILLTPACRAFRYSAPRQIKRGYCLHSFPNKLQFLQAPEKTDLPDKSKEIKNPANIREPDETTQKIQQLTNWQTYYAPNNTYPIYPPNEYALRISGYEE